MKTAAAILGTIAIAASLAACGGPENAVPATPEVQYLRTVQGEGVQGSAEQLVSAGQAVCMTLDDGYSPYDLIRVAATETEPLAPGLDNDDFPVIIGAAVGALCDRHMSAVLNEW